MTEDARTSASEQEPPGEQQPRFEVTVHAVDGGPEGLARVADLDLDRVPDPEQGMRLLATLDDCARLVREGYEVRVLREVPVHPLDPRLVASEEDARAWFAEQTRGAVAEGEL